MNDFYKLINKDLINLQSLTDNFEIGKSLLGESVFAYHIGDYCGKQILLSGGIHAREYLSTLFLIKQIRYLQSLSFFGGFYIIPIINPDGVRLTIDGLSCIEDEMLVKFLLKINKGDDFSQWKANARGVDLNVNFSALWGKGKQNVFEPSAANYVGLSPNSEIETQNIIRFLQKTKIDGSLSFHTKGEVIYYGFMQNGNKLRMDRNFAKKLARLNRYKPVRTKTSSGGMTDYIRYCLNIMSLTIELGNNQLLHPIGKEFLVDTFDRNKDVPIEFLRLMNEIHQN